MSAQSKSIHAVLVNAIGNVLIDLVLVDHGHMGIENLGGDIEKVKGQRFMFCAFPLRWYMGDGTIVRAVAITDEDHINKDVPDRVYKYGVY